MSRPPKPFLEEMEEAADPGAAPPVPDTLPEGQAMQAVAALSQKHGSALTRFAFWAFSAARLTPKTCARSYLLAPRNTCLF